MRFMLVDATNQYIRNWLVNPTLSSNNGPAGGICGTLKTLQKLSREINPDGIIFCWDGSGGSSRRKAKNKNYKEGRKPLKMNYESNMTADESLRNRLWQMSRLMEYVNQLPIIQFMFDSVEADDIIAILCRELKEHQKVIVSADKDFYQLVDDKTIVLRPVQKQLVTVAKIVDEFAIHPNNFAISRAICGDNSDNMKGIAGAGLATVAKRFPFLKEPETATFQMIFEHCKESQGTVKLYEHILEEKKLIKDNYELMQLSCPSVPFHVRQNVQETLQEYPTGFNKTEFKKMLFSDGFGCELNWDDLYVAMNRISEKQKENQ